MAVGFAIIFPLVLLTYLAEGNILVFVSSHPCFKELTNNIEINMKCYHIYYSFSFLSCVAPSVSWQWTMFLYWLTRPSCPQSYNHCFRLCKHPNMLSSNNFLFIVSPQYDHLPTILVRCTDHRVWWKNFRSFSSHCLALSSSSLLGSAWEIFLCIHYFSPSLAFC